MSILCENTSQKCKFTMKSSNICNIYGYHTKAYIYVFIHRRESKKMVKCRAIITKLKLGFEQIHFKGLLSIVKDTNDLKRICTYQYLDLIIKEKLRCSCHIFESISFYL